MKQLMNFNHVNVVGEIIVGYKRKENIKMSEQPQVKHSKVAADYLRDVFSSETIQHVEHFVMLMLNRSCRIIGWAKVSTGGIVGTVVDKRVIFQIALNSNATSIVVCHNHPSGNLQPSDADEKITREIKEAGRLLDIPLTDHIILTESGYYSFADEGKI